jgi:hypothetical protein
MFQLVEVDCGDVRTLTGQAEHDLAPHSVACAGHDEDVAGDLREETPSVGIRRPCRWLAGRRTEDCSSLSALWRSGTHEKVPVPGG